MGLSIDLIISRESYSGSPEDLLHNMNFEVLEKTGTIEILSNELDEDEIGVAIQNDYIFIKHKEMPTFFIYGEYSRKSYNHPFSRLWDNTERMLSLSLISSVNGFGYSLYSKFSNDNRSHRHLMGNYEGLAFEGDYGDVQEEEVLYKTKKANGKITYNGKEYDVFEIGTELTEDVLFNYYGKDLFSESITFQKFRVKYYPILSELPPRKPNETSQSSDLYKTSEKSITGGQELTFWKKLIKRISNKN